ncbi:MAG: T9SS type A sorting domain-containing protein [Bacteroidales bacterium]|nr:T9SS type A sorting domain-containing protein [Bacteroidales bacterium]
MKKNLLLVSLLFLAASAMAQTETMTLTTSNAIGGQVRLLLDAAPADTAAIWIDLNNDGTRDANEEPDHFAGTRVLYTIGSQTITIHGKVGTLFCNSGGSNITAVDVSNNPNLSSLNCGINSITSLDVTNNPLITYLQVYNNQLTSIDVSKNTVLDNIDCSSNSLTELDLSTNTIVTVVNCYSNSISGSNMTAFMNSLPTTTSGHNIKIFDTAAATPDLNVATTADVAIATGKNWSVINKNATPYVGVSGIDNITNSDLNILSKKGYLEFNVAQPGELVSIYNIAGKQVFQGQLNGTSVNVPLEKGIYLVRVNSKVFKKVVE